MERLRGSAETTVDEKGRFKVPAVFRESIEETWGTDFFLTSITGDDVLVYPMPVWNVFEEKVAALPQVHRARSKFLERFNTFGQPVKMDPQGRLLIPSLLRDVAGVFGRGPGPRTDRSPQAGEQDEAPEGPPGREADG